MGEPELESSTDPRQLPAQPPLRSVYSTSFPQVLNELQGSLAVTTYQASKLVLLRAEPGPHGAELNTHFSGFNKPMGFAWEPGRFAIGTNTEIWQFRDIPIVTRTLDTPDSPVRHDAAFLPHSAHITGQVQVHEMVWAPRPETAGQSVLRCSELYFVNTRFSCLATRSDEYSFVPHWKPKFITELGPEDRCHLNGVGSRDGKLRYVTALGQTNTPAGWRENKGAGGVVIDILSNETIARGLSMPHSPRWHNGQLWVLESGNGGVGTVDPHSGKYQEVCRLPGFTRGLDFAGPYAFVGLSQVRETATFSSIAIAGIPQDHRCCGVWFIDTRNGQVAGFTNFTDTVHEIFAIQFLRGLRWPEVLIGDKRIAATFLLPKEALGHVPQEARNAGGR